MFEDDTRQVSFYLATSWIPGEKHVGMLRYKMSAWVSKATPDEKGVFGIDDSEEAEKLMKRISMCKIALNLFDKDDFLIRKHDVPFEAGVTEKDARMQSLLANDSLQMDAEEYREFIDSGSYSVSWTCPRIP